MQARVASGAPRGDDDFCFELSSLVLALSGTAAGLRHLGTLPGTLAAMTQLTVLQIGTPRLQRQAMVVVRRTLLQQMKPAACDKVLRPRVQFIRAHGLAGLLVALGGVLAIIGRVIDDLRARNRRRRAAALGEEPAPEDRLPEDSWPEDGAPGSPVPEESPA